MTIKLKPEEPTKILINKTDRVIVRATYYDAGGRCKPQVEVIQEEPDIIIVNPIILRK